MKAPSLANQKMAYVKAFADKQTDTQTDGPETICLRSIDAGAYSFWPVHLSVCPFVCLSMRGHKRYYFLFQQWYKQHWPTLYHMTKA